MTVVYVALGAAIGAATRYVAGRLLDARLPWGIISVNMAGSFLLGLVSGAGLTGDALAFAGIGFCGGLTTYSTFALQTTHQGLRHGVLNAALTIPPALAACALGFSLTS